MAGILFSASDPGMIFPSSWLSDWYYIYLILVYYYLPLIYQYHIFCLWYISWDDISASKSLGLWLSWPPTFYSVLTFLSTRMCITVLDLFYHVESFWLSRENLILLLLISDIFFWYHIWCLFLLTIIFSIEALFVEKKSISPFFMLFPRGNEKASNYPPGGNKKKFPGINLQ